jgi:hypothetical protein
MNFIRTILAFFLCYTMRPTLHINCGQLLFKTMESECHPRTYSKVELLVLVCHGFLLQNVVFEAQKCDPVIETTLSKCILHSHCVCTYVYIYMFIYILYIYTYTYTYTYMYIYIHMHTVNTHVDVCTRTCTNICVYVHFQFILIFICVFRFIYFCIYVYQYICVTVFENMSFLYIYMDTCHGCIYTYIYTHTYIY